MWCHLLLAMPVIGLGLFVVLPFNLALPAYLIVAATSSFVYAKIMQAMSAPVATGREGMMGAIGEVISEINSEGQVRVHGELWGAVSDQPLPVGERVKVVDFQGVKVVVEKLEVFDASRAHRTQN